MLLLVFLILFALIFIALSGKDFYLYRQRKDSVHVGRVTLFSGITYLIIAITLFVFSFLMITNNKVQYTVQFNKISKTA